MGIYLAKIDKQRMARSKLQLLLHHRFNDSWVKVLPTQFITLERQYTNLQEDSLVYVEIEGEKIITIKDATTIICDTLQNLSLRQLNYHKQESSLKLWRESLELQAAQIYARTEDIDRREELLKIREKKVLTLMQKLKKE